MNDDQFEALDDRADKAASNVHAAAQRRPRPVFDAERATTLPQPAAVGGTRAPRRTAWVAAAAVVALVAGAVTFAATRPDGGKDTIAASSLEDPRPYVAGDLPEGMQPMTFMDLTRDSGSEVITTSMPVYGKAPDQPLAGAMLVVSDDYVDLELTPFEVDGLNLYRTGGAGGLPGGWVAMKDGESLVLLVGASEDDAVALARVVSVDDGAISVDADGLPDGWRRLVTVDDPLTVMFDGSATRKGYFAAYVSGLGSWSVVPGSGRDQGDEDFASVQVTSVAGSEATMWASRLLVSDAREVTVRGHRGFAGAFPTAPPEEGYTGPTYAMTTVSWLERPGEVLTVTGIDITDEQLMAVAEDIRPATEDEWAALTRRSQLGEFDEAQGSDTQLGRTTGTFDDGSEWALTVLQSAPYEDGRLPEGEQADGNVYTDLRVVVGGAASSGSPFASYSGSSTSGGVDGFRSVSTTDIEGRHFSSGIVADEVVRVQVQRADGTVLGEATMVELAGYTAFVSELAEDPTVLVALRADGSEAGRSNVEDLDGNVTPDLDGDGSFSDQGTAIDSDGGSSVAPEQPTETTEVSGD